MPASLTETCADGVTRKVCLNISYTAEQLKTSPIDPTVWAWEELHPANCIRLLAPRNFVMKVLAHVESYRAANIRQQTKSFRGDGRMQVVLWNEPMMRTSPAAYDPLLKPNIIPCEVHLDPKDSPNGTPMVIVKKVHFTHRDLRMNMEPKDLMLPHKELDPQQAFMFRAPKEFARMKVVGAASYMTASGNTRIRYRKLKEYEDVTVGYLVWCEALDQ